MPGKTGIETTKIIRNVLKLKNIPIIALTASESNDSRNEALKSGLNGFIIKPITPCKILEEIKKTSSELGGCNISSSENDMGWPVIKGLNTDKSKKLLLNNEYVFSILLKDFFDNYRDFPQVLKDDLMKEGSHDAVKFKLHKMKSVSGLIGADKVLSLSSDIEKNIGKNIREFKRLLELLSIEVNEISGSGALYLEKMERESVRFKSIDVDFLLSKSVCLEILELLKRHDLSVLDKVSLYRSSLLCSLGDDFNRFERFLLSFDFDQCIDIINNVAEDRWRGM